MKTMAKIVTVLLVCALIFTAVIGFMEMPVADENGEITKAQEIIVMLKTHLDKLLTTTGLTLSAVVMWLVTSIDKSSKKAFDGTTDNSKHIEKMETKLNEMDGKIDTTASQKVDVVMEALMAIFLASEMPASVREKLLAIKNKYDDIGTPVLEKSTQLIEIIANIANTAQNAKDSPKTEEKAVEQVVTRF